MSNQSSITIYDITNIDTSLDHKYDNITNPKKLAKIAILYATLAASKEEETKIIIRKARRTICKELNRLLRVNTLFVRTSYFKELTRLLQLFIKLAEI